MGYDDKEAYDRGAAGARELLGKAGIAKGASMAMTDRQRDITEHPHGQGRHRELAAHLAHKTSVSTETAHGIMGAAELDAQREERVRGDK